MAELLSFGPIEPLLRDESISEIMVNGPDSVWIERAGQLEETDVKFENDDHVRRIIDRIVAPLGRRCDEASPMVDARLPDGSRVNAIIPPISLIGPVITIRKFSREALTMQNLVQFGSITPDVADFLSLLRPGLPERPGLGRHGLGEDDAAERAVVVHPGRRADRDDRGRGRAAAAPAPRDLAGEAAGQHRGHAARSRSASSW